MNVSIDAVTGRVPKPSPISIVLTFALALISALCASAQTQSSDKPAESKPAESRPAEPRQPEIRQTFFLSNVTQQYDLNDIQTDLRNMLNRAKIYGVASQNAITIEGTAEDMAVAQHLISELDRPKKVYRLTYTFTDIEEGKRAGSQHYSLDVLQGEHSELKQGVKVPIVTGTYSHDTSAAETQFQFVDVGLRIEAAVVGARLQTKIERSSLSDEKSSAGPQDPIIRQTVFEGLTLLSQGKPVVLGSLDIPGTTRHQEVEVAAEIVQ